jgi:hypothetical protein
MNKCQNIFKLSYLLKEAILATRNDIYLKYMQINTLFSQVGLFFVLSGNICLWQGMAMDSLEYH